MEFVDHSVDGVKAVSVAAPKAWAVFKTEWRAEYDRLQVQRGIEAAARMKAEAALKAAMATLDAELAAIKV